MAAARRSDVERARTRRRVLGAGVAGVAAAVAVAPIAYASTPSPTPTPSSSAGGIKARAPKAAETTVVPDVSTTTVSPDYGVQKIRVGVQEKDGAYPPDADTSGSELTIVETGPNVVNATLTTTCLTDASTRETGSTATYCIFPVSSDRRPAAKFRPADEPDPLTNAQDYYAARPGDSVKITQTSLGPNDEKVLLIDPSEKDYSPCELQDTQLGEFGICDDTPPALFNDPGIPPVAVDDSATTPEDTAVTINVLGNDDTIVGAPVTGLVVTKDPSHGKVTKTAAPAAVTAGAAASSAPTGPKFLYTPKNGFSGIDHFSYQLTDANGTATADVTITVAAAPSSTPTPTATPSLSISATATSSTPPLAETGSADVSLGEIGALLVAVGGAATVVGRRRRRPGRHSG